MGVGLRIVGVSGWFNRIKVHQSIHGAVVCVLCDVWLSWTSLGPDIIANRLRKESAQLNG